MNQIYQIPDEDLNKSVELLQIELDEAKDHASMLKNQIEMGKLSVEPHRLAEMNVQRKAYALELAKARALREQ